MVTTTTAARQNAGAPASRGRLINFDQGRWTLLCCAFEPLYRLKSFGSGRDQITERDRVA
jgi:hypothetical protein